MGQNKWLANQYRPRETHLRCMGHHGDRPNPVQIRKSLVGTVFIASAVEVQRWWRSIPLVDEVASVIHLHGGRDEYGPYLGSLELNASRVTTRVAQRARPGLGVWKVYFATIACMLMLLFSFSSVSAHPLSGNGRIFGQLLNGTKNNAAVAGQTVTLQFAQGETAQDFATATTDAHGAYSFDNLSTDKTISYAVYIHYEGAQYVSDLVSLDSKPVQQVNLTVYEATASTAKVAILQATVLLHQPDAQKGTLTVSEVFFFKNLDLYTYVGSLDASKGKPNALLFSLPRGARNVSLGGGFDGYKVIQVDRGFATDAALPPGNTQFSFSFEVPYSTSYYDFSYDIMYPTVQLSVLVPPDIHATSGALISQGVITADSHPYHLFKTEQLLTNQEVHVELEGLPAHTATSTSSAFNPATVWLIVALTIMLAVLVVTWFVFRSTQRRSLSRRAQSQSGKATKSASSPSKDRQQALLQELLDLDKAFEAGKLSKAVYQERRAKTKARLRNLLKEQEVSR